ncbi:MAG: heavy metal translocating P-type ATPase [Acutalibacteraceae bacterium]|nr:heavy metal translocating P-type ATPase [Acutalibacteraceae bacterium]
MDKQLFNVTGMTCAACSARVEKAVKHLEGVQAVSVNLLTNSMEVRFDSNIITQNDIIASVTKAGYGASLKNKAKESKKEPQTAIDEVTNGKRRLIASLVFLAPLFYISMGHMLGMPIPDFMHGTENALIYAFTQFLLTIPIVFINFRYFKNGFKNLFRLSPNMDSLIAIGSAAAIVYGIVAIYRIGWGLGHNDIELVKRYSMDLYFESAGTILTLITLGKLLESKAKRKTTDAITRLINLRPQTALVIRNGNTEEIPIESVLEGDIIAVKSGSTIPVDGVITSGSCTVDESVITGESMPIEKSQGDNVIGATINKNGYIEIKATKVGQNSTLSQIITLVEEASATKAPVAKVADKISGVFVPIVISVAVISAIVWLLLGAGVEFSLSTGIAVLVISCPCALGLATPTAIMTGTGRGAQMGVLIKSAEALESAGKINTVVLDKTGTITMGRPQVTDVIAVNSNLIDIATSIESFSEHPLANAVVEYGNSIGYNAVEVTDFTNYGGMGVSAIINGTKFFAGNQRLMQKNDIDISAHSSQIDSLASDGKTPLIFADKNGVIGIIAVADVIKESSKQAIKELQNMNIDVVMLTGDNTATANAIAKQCGIDNVIAEVMPQDKEATVRSLQSKSKFVAMVGDGINDAPALARANIGIAIGSGTDIAIDSADVVLVKSNLTDIVRLIQLSKKTMLNIKENLFWALIYNSIGIPLAAGAFYNILGWKLNPMYGAAAMCVSSVCVVLNALRLRRFNPKFKYTQVENGKATATVEVNTITETREEEKIMTKTIIINGMMCPHCSGAVEKALNAIEGVTATVDLANKSATVTGNVDNDVLIKVITDAGYTVEEIK